MDDPSAKLVTVEDFNRFKLEVLGMLAKIHKTQQDHNEAVRGQTSVMLDKLLGLQERTLAGITYIEAQWQRFSMIPKPPEKNK